MGHFFLKIIPVGLKAFGIVKSSLSLHIPPFEIFQKSCIGERLMIEPLGVKVIVQRTIQ